MPTRKILQFPHPVLREKAQAVTTVDDDIKSLVDDMFATMYDDRGIGLAANQIGIAQRIFTIDVSHNHKEPLCFINPEILDSREKITMDEGCLSFPGLYFAVERAKWIKVRAQNQQGKFFELEDDGLLARCILHELDHINGRVFTDYLSPLKLKRAMKKLEKSS